MSDLVGNPDCCFPTRQLICITMLLSSLLAAAADSDEASGDELIKTKHKAKTKQVSKPLD